MGSMSASDAAPLPRLGEVYFDVRGESRSMRLSWYADTGVAVFSIWQGGTCTGTFRLPIADLPRMVEALRRGPHGAVAAAGEPGPAEPDPAGGYGERTGSGAHRRYEPEPGAAYPGAHRAGAPGLPGHGYPGEAGRHRPDAGDPRTGDYPAAPAAPRQDAIGRSGYPAAPGNAGYSPARPYVTSATGGGPRSAEEREAERQARDRQESDPSPDSFPYGQTPAGQQAHGRGR